MNACSNISIRMVRALFQTLFYKNIQYFVYFYIKPRQIHFFFIYYMLMIVDFECTNTNIFSDKNSPLCSKQKILK